jgi:hypothetical protein
MTEEGLGMPETLDLKEGVIVVERVAMRDPDEVGRAEGGIVAAAEGLVDMIPLEDLRPDALGAVEAERCVEGD